MIRRLFANKKRLVIWGILVISIIGLFVFAAKLNAPAKGTINKNPKLQSKPRVAAQQSAPSTQTTAYYSLSLPAGYTSVAAGAPPEGLLAVQTLTKQLAIGRLVIAIAVKQMPDGGIAGDSAYQLRIAHPERYTIAESIVGGKPVTIANDSQSAAVVAFLPHGGTLATISLTMGFEGPAADGNADELEQLQVLLRAWQWK